jgi:tetratricopeptide (TPR) repeat protein
MMWSKGFGADETLAAFARARELAAEGGADEDRYAIYYGQWLGLLNRGELRQPRATAQAFLADAAAAGKRMETAVAHRTLALNCFLLGEFAEARSHADRAIELDDPARSAESRFRFGVDCRICALLYLALANWQIGEVDLASRLSQEALTQATASGHVQTVANIAGCKAALDAARGDAEAADRTSSMGLALSREHDMKFFIAWSEMPLLWARSRLEDRAAGASKLRETVANFMAGGHQIFAPLYAGLLAELDAGGPDPNDALPQIDAAIALAQQTGERWTDSMLHRIRGDILLKRDTANPAPAEEAFRTAIAVACEQGSRSFGLQAALALAKLYRSTARPVEAHDILAPGLEGFSATPEMPEIAEAQALFAALAENDEVKSVAASRQRRLQLQTRYGQAMMYSRGFASDESKTAFARARALAAGIENASERLDAYWGLFAGSLLRGELSLARETAESFLHDAENEGRMTEASLARRCVGQARLYQGDFIDARTNLAEALRTYDPERDREARFRFGLDTGAHAAGFLALASWALGDVERARTLSNEALARADETAHAPTRANLYSFISRYHMLRGDPEAVGRIAKVPYELAREHGMAMDLAYGEVQSSWAWVRLGDRESGITELREALAAYLSQGNKLQAPLFQARLAELEAEGNDADGALRRIDQALALAKETGERWTDALLHRIRGAILVKRDPGNPAPVEEAFGTAIAIAQAQKARSFQLQAALALGKLYQSMGRLVEAHAVLAPALEGFAPTPEMPEIGEAQALLAALAETEEVKADAAQRRRMTHLQVAYGHALIATRGYGAPETTKAFTAARESAHGDNAALERLAADYGLWVGSYVRGELPSMRRHATTFLGDVEARPDSPAAGVAHRVLGATHWFAGEYVAARDHLERALALFEPARDDDLAFRFGQDAGVAAMFYLAFTLWPLGDVERAVSLVDAAQARTAGLPHVQTRAYGKSQGAMFELMRGDLSRALPNAAELAAELARLARDHDLPLWRAFGVFLQGFARAESDAPGGGLEDMRRGVDLLREQSVLMFDGLLKIALAGAEARAGHADRAVARLDEALATCERTGYRAFEAELHRVRGEMLFGRCHAN